MVGSDLRSRFEATIRSACRVQNMNDLLIDRRFFLEARKGQILCTKGTLGS